MGFEFALTASEPSPEHSVSYLTSSHCTPAHLISLCSTPCHAMSFYATPPHPIPPQPTPPSPTPAFSLAEPTPYARSVFFSDCFFCEGLEMTLISLLWKVPISCPLLKKSFRTRRKCLRLSVSEMYRALAQPNPCKGQKERLLDVDWGQQAQIWSLQPSSPSSPPARAQRVART